MTLVDIAQEKIKKMIKNKQYDSNGYLPSEGQLCIEFNVSRATIREAVRSLEVRGFVKRIHGKGVKVSDNSINIVAQSVSDMFDQYDISYTEILEIRRLIETKAAALAAERATEEELKELKSYVEYMEKSLSRTKKYIESDYKFHQCLVNATHNNILIAMNNAYTVLLKKIIDSSTLSSSTMEKNTHVHRNVYNAVANKDCKLAFRYMGEHLDETEHNLLLKSDK